MTKLVSSASSLINSLRLAVDVCTLYMLYIYFTIYFIADRYGNIISKFETEKKKSLIVLTQFLIG